MPNHSPQSAPIPDSFNAEQTKARLTDDKKRENHSSKVKEVVIKRAKLADLDIPDSDGTWTICVQKRGESIDILTQSLNSTAQWSCSKSTEKTMSESVLGKRKKRGTNTMTHTNDEDNSFEWKKRREVAVEGAKLADIDLPEDDGTLIISVQKRAEIINILKQSWIATCKPTGAIVERVYSNTHHATVPSVSGTEIKTTSENNSCSSEMKLREEDEMTSSQTQSKIGYTIVEDVTLDKEYEVNDDKDVHDIAVAVAGIKANAEYTTEKKAANDSNGISVLTREYGQKVFGLDPAIKDESNLAEERIQLDAGLDHDNHLEGECVVFMYSFPAVYRLLIICISSLI